jgi:hypothetical protein
LDKKYLKLLKCEEERWGRTTELICEKLRNIEDSRNTGTSYIQKKRSKEGYLDW